MLVIILVCSAVASGNLILGPGVASTSHASNLTFVHPIVAWLLDSSLIEFVFGLPRLGLIPIDKPNHSYCHRVDV